MRVIKEYAREHEKRYKQELKDTNDTTKMSIVNKVLRNIEIAYIRLRTP